MACPFGDAGAVEDVLAFGINGCAAEAEGEVGWGEDIEMELVFQSNGEEIVGPSVGFSATRHCDEGVRGGCD